MKILLLLTATCINNVYSAYWPIDSNGNPTKSSIQTFYINPQHLWINRNLYITGNKQLNPAINRVIRLADASLKDDTVYSVTNKPANQLPPSNDKRDFYSLARYYWPNSTAAGAAYIWIDGVTNPEIYTISDSTWIEAMITDVFNCAIAYFFTGNEVYAGKATKRLRDWFTDPKTGMNPNLNFANWVKGTNLLEVEGTIPMRRSGGILDMSKSYLIIDAIGLLRNSNSFTQSDFDSLTLWFTSYLNWLQTSPRGAFESSSQNNQGTWHDVQQVSILLFLGNATLAKQVQTTNTIGRITSQIMPDGSQPLEQLRPMSWFYSNFNLQGFFVHGALSKSTLAEVFEFETQDGRSVFTALDYLVNAGLVGGKSWPVPNVGNFTTDATAQMCKEAFVELYDVRYVQDAYKMSGRMLSWNVNRLWAPFGAYDSASLSGGMMSLSIDWRVAGLMVSVVFLYF